MFLLCRPDVAYNQSLTNAMLAGFAPVGLFFMMVSFVRYHYSYNRVLSAYL